MTGLISWLVILISYLRFYYGCKKQGLDRNEFPYKAPMQPYASFFGAFMLFVIVRPPSRFPVHPLPREHVQLTVRVAPAPSQIIFSDYQVFLAGSWDTGSFLTAYITIPWFFLMLFAWKVRYNSLLLSSLPELNDMFRRAQFWKKTTFVRLDAMDLDSGRRQIDLMEEEQRALYKSPETWYEKVWAWLM